MIYILLCDTGSWEMNVGRSSVVSSFGLMNDPKKVDFKQRKDEFLSYIDV